MWLTFVFVIVTVLLLILYLIFKYLNTTTDFWPKRGVKLIPYDVVGTLKERIFLYSPIHELDCRFYRKLKAKGLQYGGTEEFRNPVFIPADLDIIKNILVQDFDYFANRRSLEAQKIDRYFGDMLMIKEGDEWKHLRSTMTPSFSSGKIRRMFDIFNRCGDNYAHFINSSLNLSAEIDIKDAAGRYGLDVITSTAFGVDSKVFDDKNSIFSKMGKYFQSSLTGPFGIVKLALLIFLPKLSRFFNLNVSDNKSSIFFTDVIRQTRKHREETGERREDFLQLMIDSQAEEKKLICEKKENCIATNDDREKCISIKITDKSLEAQCLLFFIGGFDSSETLLVFAAYELAVNEDIQEKLAAEIYEATERNNGKLTYDVIIQMEYLDKIVLETLRKYPPGYRIERKSTRDYLVPNSDTIIPKDTTILIPVWAIHHDPEYYPDPLKFDPERFSPENKAKRHPFAFLPFGGGPRNCIAQKFALIQGKTAIVKLIQNFVVEPSRSTEIPVRYSRNINLKPEGGMKLNIKHRHSKVD